jgi:hypothetical protein
MRRDYGVLENLPSGDEWDRIWGRRGGNGLENLPFDMRSGFRRRAGDRAGWPLQYLLQRRLLGELRRRWLDSGRLWGGRLRLGREYLNRRRRPNNQILTPGIGSASCSGTITVTCTWNNEGNKSNVPPSVAIIKETSTASWTGDGTSCANGLGNPETGGPYGKTSTGDKFWVKTNPGQSFTFTCTPTASAVLGENSPSGLPAGSVGVSYQAFVFPVRLRLVGVIDPVKDKRILLGQKLRASVDLGGFTTNGQQRYTWDVKGGAPFISYTAGTPTTYAGWAPHSEFTGNTAMHFRTPSKSVEVFCEVQITEPALTFDLSQDLSPESPNRFHNRQDIGDMTLLPNDTSPDKFRLFGATYPGLNPWGMFWDYWVETPSYYGLDVGRWAFVQLVMDESTVTYGQNTSYIQTTRGWALDHSFPHPYRLGGGPWFSASGFTNVYKVHSDRPGVDFLTTPTFDSLSIDMMLDAYTVYSPPDSAAGTSAYVYLVRQRWIANGACAPGVPRWSFSDTGSAFVGGPEDHPRHAMWSQVIN